MKQKLVPFLKNKYALTVLFLLIWLLFFDSNDIVTQISSQRKLYELRKQQEFYEQKIEKTQQALKELTTNPEQLEKFAREKYRMKRPNEEIFLVVHPEEE